MVGEMDTGTKGVFRPLGQHCETASPERYGIFLGAYDAGYQG
jgi:hypothetical protein